MNYSPELLRAAGHFGIQPYYFQQETIRSDDIWLASYPRSGNHFVRFIIVSALTYQETSAFPEDFSTMKTIPGIHSGPPVTHLTPRIIKTHFPLDPRYRRIIHLIRDPRDVLVSYFHYSQGMPQLFMQPLAAPLSPASFTRLFLAGEVWPCHIRFHGRSFSERAVDVDYLLLRYEDLVNNPEAEIPRLLNFLNIKLDGAVINRLIKHTSFDNMARIFDPQSASRGGVPPSREHVVRKGKTGSYHEFLDQPLLESVEEALKDYLQQYGYMQGAASG